MNISRMNFKSGDILKVNFQFPDGIVIAHPVMVLSGQKLWEAEEMFYAVLISSKDRHPGFTIKVKSEDLTNP